MFNLVLLSCASFSTLANVVLVEGHVRAMPASVPNTAAYLTLENHGKDTRLVGVSTRVAREAQLHTMLMEDGMMKMRHVAGFDIPSHGSLALTPSGKHIMILGLKAPLSLDQQVELILEFEDGHTQTLVLPVKKTSQQAQQGEHHHQH